MRHYDSGTLKWSPFAGVHFRKRYNILDGTYVGTKLSHLNHLPFSYILKLSSQFVNITTAYEIGYFALRYTVKQPFRNPQEGLWVPTLHSLNLGVPF